MLAKIDWGLWFAHIAGGDLNLTKFNLTYPNFT